MEWFFRTRVWRQMQGESGGETGIDNEIAERGMSGIGAGSSAETCSVPYQALGRMKAGKGGGATSRPITYRLRAHAARSRAAAHGRRNGVPFRNERHSISDRSGSGRGGNLDVRIGGGVDTVRQYLRAGLIDELHLAVRPVLLGRGEALWHDLDFRALGYDIAETVAGERATHVFIRKLS